jgi:predicted phosphodiesterase
MKKLAIISDVYGDFIALLDALRLIDKLGCDLIVCAGDIVDYGKFPNETISFLQDLAIPCIRGDHDRLALQQSKPERASLEGVNHEQPHDMGLLREALEFLESRPSSWRARLEGIDVAVHHGSPRSDTAGIHPYQTSIGEARFLLDAAGADVLLGGHTHVPFALHIEGGGLIANPGALLRSTRGRVHSAERIGELDLDGLTLGAPRAGGTFGVLKLPSLDFSVFRAADGCEMAIPRVSLEIEKASAERVASVTSAFPHAHAPRMNHGLNNQGVLCSFGYAKIGCVSS